MYGLVKRILDKSREKDVDVLVAADMVAAGGIGHTKELQDAKGVIDKYYDTITKLRRERNEAAIETLCICIESGNLDAVNTIVAETAKR